MKNWMKGGIVFLLMIFLGLVFRSVNASAETFEYGGFRYEVKTVSGVSCVVITGYTGGQTEVTVPGVISNMAVTGITKDAFSGSSIVTISLPSTISDLSSTPFYQCGAALTTITVDSGNSVYSSVNGMLYNKDQTILYRCGTGIASCAVIPSTQKIAPYAFYQCKVLTALSLPDTLDTIGKSAFAECISLSTVTLPSSVTEIGDYAFGYCYSIHSVTIPAKVDWIYGGTFAMIGNLTVTVMNPDCTFDNKTPIFYNGTVLKGYSDSTTEDYATDNGIGFVSIGECPHIYLVSDVSPTCTERGYALHTCKRCGKSSYKDHYTDALGHQSKTVVTKATTKKNGVITEQCSVCHEVLKKTSISRIKSVVVSSAKYSYTGKSFKPTVKVKDASGHLISSAFYTVKYVSLSTGKKVSGLKAIGRYHIKVTFKGNYSGTVTKTATVYPRKVTLSSLQTGISSLKSVWKKESQCSGYQLQLAYNRNFTTGKIQKVIRKKAASTQQVDNLLSGKVYYVRIRAYKSVKVNGKNLNLYGSWSKIKYIKAI